MKEISAYVRRERAAEVLEALERVGIVHVTMIQSLAVGPNVDPEDSRVSMEFGRRVTPMVKLELICPDRDESRLVGVIRDAACTCAPGDGVIAVYNVNRLVKIRTAAESVEAL